MKNKITAISIVCLSLLILTLPAFGKHHETTRPDKTGILLVAFGSSIPEAQAAALRQLGIPYEVVPGVTAAFAAAAAMGLEYTMPEICKTLILTRMAGRTPTPELESLKSLAAHQASIVVYLSSSLAEKVGSVLSDAYGENASVVVAYRVSQPDQKVVRTTTKNLAETMKKEKIDRQALIIAGKVLESSDNKFPVSKLYDRTFSHGFRKADE